MTNADTKRVPNDRGRLICELLNVDPGTVVADSLKFEPYGDGWRVQYTAFQMLDAEEMARLTAEDERASHQSQIDGFKEALVAWRREGS